jgi:hypothetical protein
MAMTREDFDGSLQGFCHLAKASGLPDREAAFSLMLTALAVSDRWIEGGCSRDAFVKMAGIVHDRLRAALATGVQAG